MSIITAISLIILGLFAIFFMVAVYGSLFGGALALIDKLLKKRGS